MSRSHLPLALALVAAGCGGKGLAVPDAAARIRLTSPAFVEGAPIPEVHSCKGKELSPALAWSGVPATARSLALLCDDPDAPMGTWVHWVAHGIPPTTTELPEGVPATDAIPGGGIQGTNSFKKIGYGGPCPPKGTHRYVFKLYALDTELALPGDATKGALVEAMEGHVVGYGELTGTFRASGAS